MLSSHPGTYYLCKEKRRHYPRIEDIGDHGKVQGHPPMFLGNTNTIGDPTPVPREGEIMYVPTRRKRKGEGSERSGAGSGWYKQTQDEFLGNAT